MKILNVPLHISTHVNLLKQRQHFLSFQLLQQEYLSLKVLLQQSRLRLQPLLHHGNQLLLQQLLLFQNQPVEFLVTIAALVGLTAAKDTNVRLRLKTFSDVNPKEPLLQQHLLILHQFLFQKLLQQTQ